MISNQFGRWLLSTLLCCVNTVLFAGSSLVIADKAPLNIGMTTALSGPTRVLGENMLRGIQVYFDQVNANGGVAGHPLKLIVLDDGYEPIKAAENMHTLIDQDRVLAIIGNVGTPTATVTVPLANQKKTLLFGAFTGADLLRNTPPDRYVINYRASYAEETASMIKGLLSAGIKPEEIAFFTQNDSYGDSGYQGGVQALKKSGFSHPETLLNGRYTRNTLNVEEGLADIIGSEIKPKAIIIVAAYAPAAKFIKLAKKYFPDAVFLNVSFVGAGPLSVLLGHEDENVVVTQVVPSLGANLPAIRDYHVDMKKYGKNAPEDYISLEGYLVARLFVQGLQQAATNKQLTREGIINTFEALHDFDLGLGSDIKINLDRNHHQVLHKVWPTLLKNGKIVPLTDWLIFQQKNKAGNNEI